MAKLFYPQISLEDYQIFRKFMLPGEFPQTHDQWVASHVGEDETEAQKTALVLASPPRKSVRHTRWNDRFGS